MNGFYHVKPVAILQAQINHGKGWRLLLHFAEGFGNALAHAHFKATAFHGAAKPLQKRAVIIDQKE
jgi:hypothetical protein